MKFPTRINNLLITMVVIFSIFYTFIVPISAKPVPANSVFNQNTNVQEQNDESKMDNSFGNVPVYFEQNNGQFDKRAKYFARGTNGYSLFLTATEAVYVLSDSSEFRVQSSEFRDKSRTLNSKPRTPNSATAVYMKLAGANENSASVGLEEMPHKTNYFKGKKENWRTDIPNFKQIRMENVYQGIDTVWHGKENGGVQYDFVVEPNANPNLIEWEIDGAESVELDQSGNLLIKTDTGTLKQQKPFTYQENTAGLRQEIESLFEVRRNNRIGFVIGGYDESKTLTIDPNVTGGNQLLFSTFLGGNQTDEIESVKANQNQQVFVAGRTNSPNFPTTPGSFDTSSNNTDGFVAKLSPALNNLVYSTFLGGDNFDFITDIKVSDFGEVYATGGTRESGLLGFPTTSNAFDSTHNGNSDTFMSVLSPDGNILQYSSFLGSDHNDIGRSIEIDNFGNAFITGETETGQITVNAFPTTSGAFDTTHNGGTDVFVTKINLFGTLGFSTFIGGQADDEANDLATDAVGNIYITGETQFNGLFGNYPTTAGSFDTSHNGGSDAFVTKLNSSGSALVYSTYLGGGATDRGISIAFDGNGNSYITGETEPTTGTAFPTTAGAFDTTQNLATDIFVSKLNPNGSSLVFSTFIGGTDHDDAYSITRDRENNLYIGGKTNSSDFPVSPNALSSQRNGSSDGFVTRLSSDGSRLLYSTYIGGGGSDWVSDIELRGTASERIWITGATLSDTPNQFPTTNGAFDTSHNGNFDGFISRLEIPLTPSSAPFDFDGDNKTDISIFRPSVGEWWYLRSSNGGNGALQFGNSSDIITPGDFTGDGKADFAFFRPSNGNWFILRSEDSSFFAFPFGANGDIPAPGDYDGDGKTDAAVFRPSIATWFILNSGGSGTSIIGFGLNGDKPVVADYDGDGKDDIGIYRPSNSQWWIDQSSAGVSAIQFGSAGDQTVQGDYTGDGKADFAFFRPSNGNWFIVRSEDSSFFSFPFGSAGDIPVPGDYDGDGKYDSAVFRPTNNTWYLNQTTAGVGIVGFGSTGDKPVPSAYVYQ